MLLDVLRARPSRARRSGSRDQGLRRAWKSSVASSRFLLGPSHSRMMLVAFFRVSSSLRAALAAAGGGGKGAEPVLGASFSGVLPLRAGTLSQGLGHGQRNDTWRPYKSIRDSHLQDLDISTERPKFRVQGTSSARLPASRRGITFVICISKM